MTNKEFEAEYIADKLAGRLHHFIPLYDSSNLSAPREWVTWEEYSQNAPASFGTPQEIGGREESYKEWKARKEQI